MRAALLFSITTGLMCAAHGDEIQVPAVFEHGVRGEKKVALTFDACSTTDNGYEPKIIETLKSTRTPATLFLAAGWRRTLQW
jgi:peptidoglycan/xylan/chitin deacetylase (PgdA/CDA1 family)